MKNEILVVRANDVNKICVGKEKQIMELVKETYIAHNQKQSSLPHSVFLRFPNSDSNRIIGLPAYVGGQYDIAGIKWISSFPNNIEHEIERASAVNILNNMTTGRAEAVLEGSIISAKRTAASAALAAYTVHGDKSEKVLGAVGCGRINREIISFLRVAFPTIEKIYIYDKDEHRAVTFAENLRNESLQVELASSVDNVFEEATLVSFATTAGIPYVNEIKALRNETTILNISLRDFASQVVLKCDNIVDDIDHVLRERTSVHLTEQKVGNRDFIRCPLADILEGNQPVRIEGKPVMFSPFGLGVLDMTLSNYVKEEAINSGYGITIENFQP